MCCLCRPSVRVADTAPVAAASPVSFSRVLQIFAEREAANSIDASTPMRTSLTAVPEGCSALLTLSGLHLAAPVSAE